MKKLNISKLKRKGNNTPTEKDKKKKKIAKNTIISGILIAGIAVVSLILAFALYVILTSPEFDKEKLYQKESSVLYYNDGVTELARIGKEDTVLKSYDELPQILIDAIVATEDSRFFQHKGLDVARFLKASFGQLLGKKNAGGASTLTMQVVKQTYTNSKDEGLEGIIRKFTDIYMAVFKIESNYTKEEILEFYVNSQWLGNDGNLNYTGIAGVEQACQYYFGKSVSDISLAEASIIAGMFQNPTRYNPYRYPERIKARQKTVLTLMVNHGYITEEQKEDVLAIPIESLLADKKVSKNNGAQASIDYVINEVKKRTGYDASRVPMKIVTTIDKNTQDVLNKLENGELYKFPNDVIQEGIAITNTENGSIAALSGGRNYGAKGLNRANVKRQPGSTAKPIFDYGPYIEYLNGAPSTLFMDEETSYSNGQKIKNSNGKYNGLMTMREALRASRNIPALRAFKAVNAEKENYIEDFVHGLGIDYGQDLYESASIGGFDGATPIQMSAAYASFGRGGYYIEPYSYTEATLLETGEKFEYKPERKQVMSEQTAYLVTEMLVYAANQGVGGVKVSGTDIGAKSGTTNLDDATTTRLGIPASSTRDSWNITFSPEYSIAVWIGYDQTTSKNYLNLSLGNQIRKAVMKAVGSKVYSKNKKFEEPTGIITVEIEKDTIPTQLASEFTPADMRVLEIFKEGTEPTDVSTRYEKLAAPTGGKYTFNGSSIRLSWNAIETPDAINTTYLQDYFNTYFEEHATKYYEKRIAENNSKIGTLGYQVYQKNTDGTLTLLGRTDTTNYTINTPTESGTYVIKSAYSIFKSNMSDGLEIKTNATIETPVEDIIGGDTQDKPNTPDTGNNDLD